MNFFGKKLPRHSDQPANQTTAGVRMMKEVWDIQTKKSVEAAPTDVSWDIYSIKPKSNGIPPRRRNRRPAE